MKVYQAVFERGVFQPIGHVDLPEQSRVRVEAAERPSVRPVATEEALRSRRAALQGLRALGGLRDVISDPSEWQREMRLDRELPHRND